MARSAAIPEICEIFDCLCDRWSLTGRATEVIKDYADSRDYELRCCIEQIDRLPQAIKDCADSRDYELHRGIEQIDRLPQAIKDYADSKDYRLHGIEQIDRLSQVKQSWQTGRERINIRSCLRAGPAAIEWNLCFAFWDDVRNRITSQAERDPMNRRSPRITAVIVGGIGLALAAVASGERPAEQTPAGSLRPEVTQGMTEMVAVSKAANAIVAYSVYTGRWHKQSIPAGHDNLPYVVGNGLVAFRIENTLYGFSSEKGAWDTIKVSPEAAGLPTVGHHIAHVQTGSKIYAFSRMTGNWSMIDLSAP